MLSTMPKVVEFCIYCGAGRGRYRKNGEGTCHKCITHDLTCNCIECTHGAAGDFDMNIGEQTKLQLKLREWIALESPVEPEYKRSKFAKELLAEFFPEDPMNAKQAKEVKSNGGW